jgi:membrane protease YdiL (CAAX protease family)
VRDQVTPRAGDLAHADAVARRRWWVVGATLVIGCALLGVTLRVPRSSGRFTALGLLLAATWTAGAFLSGPVPVFPRPWRRPARSLLGAVAIGALAFLGFFIVYLVARNLPLLSSALDSILSKRDAGPSAIVVFVAIVTGISEELFFRGAVQSVRTRYNPVAVATVAYVVVTASTGNIALVIAAAVMGTIFSIERAATGAVAASIATHVTWTLLMLLLLPR